MIILGLGNPGGEYEGTRHNLGYAVLDLLAQRHNANWKIDKTDSVWMTSIGQHLLVKPKTFMNLSGQAFYQFWHYRRPDSNPDANELLVVHDDLDLPLGDIRAQSNRSAAGHRGIESLIETLGSQNFHRLRIGVGNNREKNIPAEVYVLEKFPSTERGLVDETIAKAVQQLEDTLGLVNQG